MGPTPGKPAQRPFRMADLMILVAACGAGIAWTKLFGHYTDLRKPYWGNWRNNLILLLELPNPCLFSIGTGILISRLQSPRPPLRRLARQPGAVALACMGLTMAAEWASFLAGRGLISLSRWPRLTPIPIIVFDDFLQSQLFLAMCFRLLSAGLAIAACWLLMLVLGRWRAEATWIDRLGRCLGAYLIFAYVVSTFANFML